MCAVRARRAAVSGAVWPPSRAVRNDEHRRRTMPSRPGVASFMASAIASPIVVPRWSERVERVACEDAVGGRSNAARVPNRPTATLTSFGTLVRRLPPRRAAWRVGHVMRSWIATRRSRARPSPLARTLTFAWTRVRRSARRARPSRWPVESCAGWSPETSSGSAPASNAAAWVSRLRSAGAEDDERRHDDQCDQHQWLAEAHRLAPRKAAKGAAVAWGREAGTASAVRRCDAAPLHLMPPGSAAQHRLSVDMHGGLRIDDHKVTDAAAPARVDRGSRPPAPRAGSSAAAAASASRAVHESPRRSRRRRAAV